MNTEIHSWKCSVCGYVSDTQEPPDNCPVCGVPKDKFDTYETSKSLSPAPSYWQCMICNYRHKGVSPPESCPVCGAGSEKFEGVKDSKSEGLLKNKGRIVIAGAGIAGIAAAEEIRNLSDTVDITLVNLENELPYYRLNLTRYIAGEVKRDELPIHPESWYKENRINVISGIGITDIDIDKKRVILTDGKRIDYDKLILTAGSHPFQPPVPGHDLDGVTTLRSLKDAESIITHSQNARSVVVVGGGVLGLETAGALSARTKGTKISLIEGYGYLMPRQLNKKAANYLECYLSGLDIDIVKNTTVREIRNNGSAKEVVLGNGDTINADLVIFSVGVRPETYLARDCGLKVNNGVIVDDNMETSSAGIFAAGDIAEHRGTLYGLWNAAMFQGKIAGMNAVGKKSEFGGIPRSNTLKVLDVNLFSIGNFNACDGSCITIEEESEQHYFFILFRDTKIEGVVLYGDTSASAPLKTAIEEKVSFPASLILQNNVKSIVDYMESYN